MDCRIKSGNDECETLPLPLKTPPQKFAAVPETLAVDAVADAGREMPLNRNVERGQTLRCLKQRLRRNEVVAIAVDQQDRRTGFDLGGKLFGIEVRWQHQQSGIAHDRRRRPRAAQSDM